jgi:hypothetical protein
MRKRECGGLMGRHIFSASLNFSGVLGMSLFIAFSGAHADQFAEKKQQKTERCQAIDENAYSTGMIFNPEGQETMFERSRCFQELAVEERDPSLCGKVVERKSWFFDGSAISEKRCQERVRQGIEKDRRDFAAKDFSQLHRLRSFSLARNGNGKDFDFELETEGSMSGAYELKLIFTPAGRGDTVAVYEKTNRFADTDSRKVILLRHSLLKEKLGATFDRTEWSATVTLRFAKTAFNRFYYDAILANDRSSRLEMQLRFADLPAWKPEPLK